MCMRMNARRINYTHTHMALVWQLCVCALCSLLLLTGHVCVILHTKLQQCRRVSAFDSMRRCQRSIAWCALDKSSTPTTALPGKHIPPQVVPQQKEAQCWLCLLLQRESRGCLCVCVLNESHKAN